MTAATSGDPSPTADHLPEHPPAPEHDPGAPSGSPEVVLLDGSGAPGTAVGGKGAALDRLIGWGVPVPPTAVVTAAAFRRCAQAADIQEVLAQVEAATDATAVDAEQIDLAFRRAGLPTDLREAVATAAREVGRGRPVVVRSSATVEDLAGSSFAGQYRSVLAVDSSSPDEVERAVLEVFASLHHPAPRAYRAARGIGEEEIAMAAVVMPMIDAQRAGVVFTQDPVALEPMVRVEVVEGLGEALVSGQRTPSVLQVPRRPDGGAIDPSDLDPVAAPPELLGAVAHALDIERRSGVAQDVEWAWDGTDLWIVQARPITATRLGHGAAPAAGDPLDDDPGSLVGADLTTEGIGEMLPGVLPPLVWELASFVVEDGFRTMLDRLGGDVSSAIAPRWLIRRVRGRAALDVSRLAVVMAPIPGAEARVRAAYGMDDGHPPTSTDSTDPTSSAGAATEPTEPTAARLQVLRHARRAAAARRRALFDADVVVHAVMEIEAHPIDADRHTTTELLARRTALVALAARAMAGELTVSADAGAIHDAVRALLGRYLPADDAARWADRVAVPDQLAPAWDQASAAVIGGPTWAELGLPPAPASSPADRSSGLEELRRALEATPRWPAPGVRRRLARRRLTHLVERAAAQLGRRERTKAAILAIGGELRRTHLELGRRLVAMGALAEPEEIDLLSTDEVRAALRDAALPEPVDLPARRADLERHRAAPPLPARWQGTPPARAPSSDGGTRLTGLAASGGRFTGRARRVDGPQDPIGSDEVLVAAATDPSWTPVLVRCAALVIERGGPLSHAAILAREFGLPAVFDVADAVARLDGRVVLVDGDAGTVDVLDADPTDAAAGDDGGGSPHG